MLLLVSGWPACGKTYFGEWLEAQRGFHHLEVEDFQSGRRQDIQTLWAKHMPAAAPKFVAALRKQHPRWVLTWGAPAHCMPHLEALRAAGFDTWFFMAASDQRSRLAWLQREREIDPEAKSKAWDKQADEIRKGARDLRRFFRDHCIETLNTHGERTPCETLAERMGVPATVRS